MTQGWGYTPPEGSGSGAPGGGGDDATRIFPPVTPGQAGAGGYQHNPFQSGQWGAQGPQGQNQPQGYPQNQQNQRGQQGQQGNGGGNGTKIALIIVVILLVIALGVLLATQWNSLFGSDDSDNGVSSPATTTVVVPPDAGGSGDSGDTDDSAPTTTASQARPTSADLPGGVTPVNAAAQNGEPTGNFNSIWLSGPTTPGFAENVRNSYVEAYRVDRKTDQTVTASSPTTGQTYTMSCSDQGSYIHCTGGNDANVYIA